MPFLSIIPQAEALTDSDQESQQYSTQPANGAEVDEIPGLGNSTANTVLVASPTSSRYLTPPLSADSNTMLSPQVQLPSEAAFTRRGRGRGARRPVASDFVDVEDAHSSNGDSSMTRRRTRSGMNFSNVTSMRRCIIDLSDSEDDDYPHSSPELIKRSPTSRAQHSSGTSRLPSRSSPAPLSSTKARSATVTPSPEASALELQILKMREEIAQMEQNMKRKAVSLLCLLPVSALISIQAGKTDHGVSKRYSPFDNTCFWG